MKWAPEIKNNAAKFDIFLIFLQDCDVKVLFGCVEVLRPSQQLRSCRVGQLPINIVPGQA